MSRPAGCDTSSAAVGKRALRQASCRPGSTRAVRQALLEGHSRSRVALYPLGMKVGAALTGIAFVAYFGSALIWATTGYELAGRFAITSLWAIYAVIAVWAVILSGVLLRSTARFAKRFVKPS
jgi:hypothetical protein